MVSFPNTVNFGLRFVTSPNPMEFPLSGNPNYSRPARKSEMSLRIAPSETESSSVRGFPLLAQRFLLWKTPQSRLWTALPVESLGLADIAPPLVALPSPRIRCDFQGVLQPTPSPLNTPDALRAPLGMIEELCRNLPYWKLNCPYVPETQGLLNPPRLLLSAHVQSPLCLNQYPPLLQC